MSVTSEALVTLGYLERMIEQFRKDPPDTDYQRGYLAALEELARVAKEGTRD
jgi:hypothetical protein